MKKFIILAILILSVALILAQTNTPRACYVRILNTDGSAITSGENLSFEATINNGSTNTLTNTSTGCNFTIAGGNTYAKIELGNFYIQWEQGNIVTVIVTRSTDQASGTEIITIPDNETNSIWWGRPGAYPGTPLELIAPQPTTHIISGMITSQWDLSGVEISATDIVPTDITYDAGAYTVTVPDGWDGTVTPYKEGYIFEPASYTYTDVIADTPNQDFVMKTVVVPGVPTNLSPNATTLTYTEPTAVVLTWDAVAIAEGYKLQWNEGEIQDLGNVLTWTTPALDAGTYTWKVCAYNNTATKSYTPVRVQINSRSNSPANSPKADGGWAQASFDVNIVTYDIPDGTPVTPPDAIVTVTITITGGSANYGSGVLPPWVNPSFVPVEQYFLDLIGAGPWTITFNTTAPWGAYFLNGIWNAVQNSGVEISFTVTAAKDIEDLPIILGESDPTLPVELSYFAATLTAENFVNIAWTTQTETNMNGFNIYRNDGSENLAGAIQIAYIPATNTSTTQNYKHIDREVENGHTYYYWLECVEMNNHSTFNGPSPVYVDGPTPPVLPEYTTMQNAYPNPFRAGDGTTIKVDVKAGDTGTVTIYNILGQVVKTFPVTQGTNNLTWNARDSKGNLCGNGIYFYKLSTNSLNQTKKMVIVK